MSYEIAKDYLDDLDEMYKKGSLTADLINAVAKEGANKGELLIQKITVGGLQDYNKTTGYGEINGSSSWETVKVNYDRGGKMPIDARDSEEAMVDAQKLYTQLVKQSMIPEDDAFTFAKIAGTTGVGLSSNNTYSTGAEWVAAIRDGQDAIDNGEAPDEDRILYITASGLGKITDASYQTTEKGILEEFSKVVKVPAARFFADIVLGNNGFTSNGAGINFMIVCKSAVVKAHTRKKARIFTPEENLNADAYQIDVRECGYVDVYDNKVKGIYVNTK